MVRKEANSQSLMVASHSADHASPDIEIGNEPPMLDGDRKSAPDRREVSLRWLSGTALTGLTSTILMSAALFAALDGRELLAVPAEVATSDQLGLLSEEEVAEKGPRVFTATTLKAELSDRRRMDVSMVTRVGDSDVIRTKPFEHVQIALAAGHSTDKTYPAFNPLNIFSDGAEPETVEEDGQSLIYGANVETEVEVRIADFSFNDDIPADSLALSDSEAEEIVRETAAILTDGTVQLASLHYVDPFRFGIADPGLASGLGLASAARIVPENMSVAARENKGESGFLAFDEDLIELNDAGDITPLLEETGYGKAPGIGRRARDAAADQDPEVRTCHSPWPAGNRRRRRDRAGFRLLRRKPRVDDRPERSAPICAGARTGRPRRDAQAQWRSGPTCRFSA